MKLAVYFDEANPEAWISREESALVKKCCKERGAEIVDNEALPKHLEGEAKIIVFAHDVVPESSLEKLKSFLEKGGVIVWLGDVPFIKAVKNGEVRSLGGEGGLGVLGFIVSLMFIYLYPSLVASSRGKMIDANLPFIANAMAILASAGVTPEKIFYSLSKTEEEFGVGREARTIIRDMELLGVDIIQALRFGVKYSPSKNFANLLQGIIENTRSGGDLAGYLRDIAGYYIRETRRRLRDFLETLGFIAEAYVTILVAGPLMLVVMLSIMSFLGGTFLGFGITFLLYLTTYILLPVAVIALLILLSIIVPKR